MFRIDFPRYTSGTTHTADALKYATDTAFKTQNGMRPNAAKIAIVITDGKLLGENHVRVNLYPFKSLFIYSSL